MKQKMPPRFPSLHHNHKSSRHPFLLQLPPYHAIVLDDGVRKGGTSNGAPVMTSQLRVVAASGPGCGALLLLTPSRLAPAVSQGP